MVNTEYINYDDAVDHLTIYKANEKIDSNIDAGLVILSLNKKREIVGIEFMGINKNFKVPLDILKHITGCGVEINYNPYNKIIVINISLKYQEKESPIVFSSNLDLGKTAFSETFACNAAA